MMKLYTVRHGQTDWNAEKKIQGITDIPLNEQGIEQAGQTKVALDGVELDVIYCSPLKRARQTAEIINGDRQIPIFFDERLKEREFGEFEGESYGAVNFADFWAYSKNLTYERAENVRAFFVRVYGVLDEIKQRHPDQSVLIVAHGGVLKAVECYAKGMMADAEIQAFVTPNAYVREYTI